MAEEVKYYNNYQIGGKGVIVEMDESKFGKRKYNKGHPVEGNWVWGAVERIVDPNTGQASAGRCVMVVVPKRDIPTLKPLILRFIKPGSYIISDCYSSYKGTKDYPSDRQVMSDSEYYHYFGYLGSNSPNPFRNRLYKHDSINHSENYRDPITGAHTNTIEGQWRIAKEKIPERVYSDTAVLQEYLYEQAWESKRKSVGRFYGMLDSMKMVRTNLLGTEGTATARQLTGEHTGEHPWQRPSEINQNHLPRDWR
jgi:hypothetical protein